MRLNEIFMKQELKKQRKKWQNIILGIFTKTTEFNQLFQECLRHMSGHIRPAGTSVISS